MEGMFDDEQEELERPKIFPRSAASCCGRQKSVIRCGQRKVKNVAEKPIKKQSGASEEDKKSDSRDLYLIPGNATDEDIEALLDQLYPDEQETPPN